MLTLAKVLERVCQNQRLEFPVIPAIEKAQNASDMPEVLKVTEDAAYSRDTCASKDNRAAILKLHDSHVYFVAIAVVDALYI
jgi:hypothetical protein